MQRLIQWFGEDEGHNGRSTFLALVKVFEQQCEVVESKVEVKGHPGGGIEKMRAWVKRKMENGPKTPVSFILRVAVMVLWSVRPCLGLPLRPTPNLNA